MSTSSAPEGLLTVREAAQRMGRSEEQVRRYLREGRLEGRRLGGQWFIVEATMRVPPRANAAPAAPAPSPATAASSPAPADPPAPAGPSTIRPALAAVRALREAVAKRRGPFDVDALLTELQPGQV